MLAEVAMLLLVMRMDVTFSHDVGKGTILNLFFFSFFFLSIHLCFYFKLYCFVHVPVVPFPCYLYVCLFFVVCVRISYICFQTLWGILENGWLIWFSLFFPSV